MKTSALPVRVLAKRFRTVEGTVLTPGSLFKADGGPYYEYLDNCGRKAVEPLYGFGVLKFMAYCASPVGEFIEAWHYNRLVRLFLTPMPPTTMTPGLVLAPYLIHDLVWRSQV